VREPQQRVARRRVASHGGKGEGAERENRVVQGRRHGHNVGRAGVGTAPGGRAGGGEANAPAPSGSCGRPRTRAAGGRGWVIGGRERRHERCFRTRGGWRVWLARAASPRVRQQRDGDSGAAAPAGVRGYATQATWPEARPTPARCASSAPMQQLKKTGSAGRSKVLTRAAVSLDLHTIRSKIQYLNVTSTDIKYMRK